MGEVSGTVFIRPIRVGFVASEISLETLREVSLLATGVWGGVYSPIFAAGDEDLMRRVEALAIDVLHPLDDLPETLSITETPGFGWRGGGAWGLFGALEDPSIHEGVLPVARVVDATTSSNGPACWGDDATGAIYDIWLGRDPAHQTTKAPSPSLGQLNLDTTAIARSPIAVTASRIEHRGDEPGLVVVAIGDDPTDLLALWNLRAIGAQVVPWIWGDEEASAALLESWLGDDAVAAHAHSLRLGNGEDLPPLVSVRTGEGAPTTVVIHDVIDRCGFTADDHDHVLWGGWRGHHPLAADIERTFSVNVQDDAWQVNIPLPAFDVRGPSSHFPGTVVAHVGVYREEESASGRTLVLPAIRALSPIIERSTRDMERFHRATGDGRAVGVQASATSVRLGLIPTALVFEQLFADEHVLGQSDDGRFTTQFIERLGGADSSAASEPATRQVLYDLSNADRSQPIPKLINAAHNHRGAWPGALSNQSPRDYASSVVYRLINSGLVVPTAAVRCPRCASETDVRPEDVATEMRCAVCRAEVTLGLALALQRQRSPWRYRLAAHLPPGRVRSGLAAMATNAVLRTSYRAGHGPAVPHVFGLTVGHDGWSCEIDIAALIVDGPMTLAVVAEVKGGRDQINATDVTNLQRVQSQLRQGGVETFILIGTTRERLEPEEITLLRAACEAAPTRIRRHDAGLALPIVLCASDLSRPFFDEEHPWRWGSSGGGPPLASLAEGGCTRNLGLEGPPRWQTATGAWAWAWSALSAEDSEEATPASRDGSV